MENPADNLSERKKLGSSASAKKLPEVTKFGVLERTTPKGLKPDSLQFLSNLPDSYSKSKKKPSESAEKKGSFIIKKKR
jgi:hypothetical protein